MVASPAKIKAVAAHGSTQERRRGGLLTRRKEKRDIAAAAQPKPRLVVFTDLDGTLLDHATYDFAPARPALDALKARGIPLVLASSKTAAEIAPLQRELGISYPAIVENGGGAFIPEGYFPDDDEGFDAITPDSVPRAAIMDVLAALPEDLRGAFEGFADWSAREVARRTGLGVEGARLARLREWSEAGVWNGGAAGLRAFEAALAQKGLRVLRGGRFLQVMGRTDKASVMERLMERFAAAAGRKPASAALGDAPNDAAMLDAADYGFIIPNPEGTPLPPLDGEESGRIVRLGEAGPAGWNRAVLGLLTRMKGSGKE